MVVNVKSLSVINAINSVNGHYIFHNLLLHKGSMQDKNKNYLPNVLMNIVSHYDEMLSNKLSRYMQLSQPMVKNMASYPYFYIVSNI